MNWLRLHVSNLCNFKCPNCHVFELGENNLPNRVMSEEVFNQSVDQFLSAMSDLGHKTAMISIYGGETLANKKVIKQGIERYGAGVGELKLTWVVNTNGSLLTEDDTLFFLKHNVEIHISVDGPEEIHNISRPTHKGKGTFHMVVPALELIKKYKSNAQINSYMMPSNFEYLREIIDIAYQYDIKKIYLDQFYNLDMISHEVGMQKYRDAYFYGIAKGVSISGPWAKVINRYHRFSPRKVEMVNRIAMDVNIDGTYYFPVNIESKKETRHISGFQDFVKSGSFMKTIEEGVEKYQKSCESCPIEKHCFGTAIEQVHYHIGEDAATAVSCNFFRDWVDFLNRPVYFKKYENLDVVSVIDLTKAEVMIQDVREGIEKLEKRFWPLNEKVILHIVQYPEELRGSSGQYNLPDWTLATTRGKNHFYHMGTVLSRGYMHELTHFFLAQKNLKIPRWFTEGICEWVRSPRIDDTLLRQSMAENNIMKHILNSDSESVVLIELDQAKLDENKAYYQVKGFVLFLVQIFGEAKLFELLHACEKAELTEGFQQVMNRSLSGAIEEFLLRN